jgi:tetratricopeptide (TPR) repeat protein
MQFKEWNGIRENLGRFRLSVSSDDPLDRALKRSLAVKLADPWARLVVAYRLVGDHQAEGSLLTHHPAAAAGIADLYQSAGRTREAVPHLAKASTANPQDTFLSLKVAALQAWFGQDKELAATRQRIQAFAKDTKEAMTAVRAARACSILPYTDKGELEAVLVLARTGIKLGTVGELGGWSLLALGMAEYRSGNFAAAVEALIAAAKNGPNNLQITGTAAFYRAMSLFRQGNNDEARKLAIAAKAKMKPLPADEQGPLAGNSSPDDVILWLAYKEAKALIQFDAASAPEAENDKK